MGSGGSSTEAEREPLVGPAPQPRRPPGLRWRVLCLFSLLGLLQGCVRSFWGPGGSAASAQLQRAAGLRDDDAALLLLWGPAGFIPGLVLMWLLDKKGLRAALLLSAFFMLLGSALRSIPLTEQPLRRWLIHGGHILNGLAGPTIMSAGPFLSTTWFAPDQRATATAVASLSSYLGSAASFVIAPLVVPAPNRTWSSPYAVAAVSDSAIRDRIQLVMYAELTVIAVLFAAVLLYFPSRPPMPPSVAAASQRLSYRTSICRLLSNVRFLMLALAYAVPSGLIAGWAGVLNTVLTPAKVSQVDAGWIGFWSTVGGCVFGVAMARFADSIRGMLKLILVLMLAGASLSSTWFTLTCLSSFTHLPSTAAILYTSCILVGIFINSSVPIFFELLIETVYPVPEGITCGVATFLGNLVSGLLLIFLTFYSTDLSWLNWCLTGSCLFSLVLILFFRESYDRLYLDVFVSV
ncbi:solute carrier family 49 member 4 isoform X1 [Anoplopoma fimbria]|uniref:solute carrier family 49 member 4 isoform X1 n=1 Tax=Anoplopoma fimbria TaxID=229290 RepID=UPI0023EC1AB2|nr:solute carrier family 49 member 4 isoform X1 [Anoplopoma fimbria]